MFGDKTPSNCRKAVVKKRRKNERPFLRFPSNQHILIPASYLRQAASKIQDKAARLEVSSTVDLLTSDFNRGSGPFELYGDAERKGMLEAAEECAAFFQRSSSAVEGRNGQLSLKHHNLHRLTGRKRECTVLSVNSELVMEGVSHAFYLKSSLNKKDGGMT